MLAEGQILNQWLCGPNPSYLRLNLVVRFGVMGYGSYIFLKESARFKFYRIGFSWFGGCQEGGNLQGAGFRATQRVHIPKQYILWP